MKNDALQSRRTIWKVIVPVVFFMFGTVQAFAADLGGINEGAIGRTWGQDNQVVARNGTKFQVSTNVRITGFSTVSKYAAGGGSAPPGDLNYKICIYGTPASPCGSAVTGTLVIPGGTLASTYTTYTLTGQNVLLTTGTDYILWTTNDGGYNDARRPEYRYGSDGDGFVNNVGNCSHVTNAASACTVESKLPFRLLGTEAGLSGLSISATNTPFASNKIAFSGYARMPNTLEAGEFTTSLLVRIFGQGQDISFSVNSATGSGYYTSNNVVAAANWENGTYTVVLTQQTNQRVGSATTTVTVAALASGGGGGGGGGGSWDTEHPIVIPGTAVNNGSLSECFVGVFSSTLDDLFAGNVLTAALEPMVGGIGCLLDSARTAISSIPPVSYIEDIRGAVFDSGTGTFSLNPGLPGIPDWGDTYTTDTTFSWSHRANTTWESDAIYPLPIYDSATSSGMLHWVNNEFPWFRTTAVSVMWTLFAFQAVLFIVKFLKSL